MNTVKPTVGRIVHFSHASFEEPQAALIIKVWNDNCVNVRIFKEDGESEIMTSVQFQADGEPFQKNRISFPPRV